MPNGALCFIRLSVKTEHAAVRTKSTLGSVQIRGGLARGAHELLTCQRDRVQERALSARLAGLVAL